MSGYLVGTMWDHLPTTAIYEEPHATLLKKLFAAALLRHHDNPFQAAREVEDHPGKAAFIAQHWTNDEIVEKEKTRLLSALGKLARVPDKDTFAAEVYEDGKNAKTAGDKLAFYKFFAQIMGYSAPTEGPNININNMVGAKIMAVPIASSDEEWERAAKRHQEQLVSRHG